MDGKIAWLLWPRHELSPVSACFLLAAFHNSFILWWRHGRTPVRVCTCIRVLHAMHHFSPPRSARAAFFRLYLSAVVWWTTIVARSHEYTLEALSHWSTSESRPLDHRGQLRSFGPARRWVKQEEDVYVLRLRKPGLLQRVIHSLSADTRSQRVHRSISERDRVPLSGFEGLS